MQFQVETVEKAIKPVLDAQGNHAQNENGELLFEDDGFPSPQSGWIPAYICGGRWLQGHQGFNIREAEFVHVKGNFKKPPTAGTTEDFDPRTKQNDPSKSVNFKYAHPEHGEMWVKVVGRAQQQGGGQRPSAPRTPPGGSSAPQRPQQALRAVPTETEYLSEVARILKRATRLIKGTFPDWSGDAVAHAATSSTFGVLIGKARSEVADDPTAEQLAAAETARLRTLDDAKKLIEANETTAAVAALPAMAADDDRIPF